jgi:hypothetical protein
VQVLRFFLNLFRGSQPPGRPRETKAKVPAAPAQKLAKSPPTQSPRKKGVSSSAAAAANVSAGTVAATHKEVMRRLLTLILVAGQKNQAAGVSAAICARCHVEALSEGEFHAACHKHGIVLINGSLYGSSADDPAKRDLAQRIEGAKGFQCMNCRTIYCSACLTLHAPAHTYGGKACPKCGNRFERLRRA